jgi:integrase
VHAEVKVRHTLSSVRDVDTGVHLIVKGKPKTAAGARTIPLVPEVVSALRVHKMAQGGPGYVDQGYVFAEIYGTPIHPDSFRQRFEWQMGKSGLPRIRFHDLRHTFASGLLAAGENPVEVSRILGHAKVSTTMNIYAHVMPGRDQAMVARLGERLFGAGS